MQSTAWKIANINMFTGGKLRQRQTFFMPMNLIMPAQVGKCESERDKRDRETWLPAMWVSALNFVIEISWTRKCDKPRANVVWQDIISCTQIFVALSASWQSQQNAFKTTLKVFFVRVNTGWHAHSCTRMHVHQANANYIVSVAATKCDTTSNTK